MSKQIRLVVLTLLACDAGGNTGAEATFSTPPAPADTVEVGVARNLPAPGEAPTPSSAPTLPAPNLLGPNGASTPNSSLVTEMTCGDRALAPGEACDDGNGQAGDGCSADCLQIEPGYVCELGQACIQAEVCGDSVLELDETCDDGNAVGGDGCAPSCQVERGYTCPDVGLNCLNADRCGDSVVSLLEQCDDGNRTPGDGCASTCQMEQGWYCPRVGPGACEPVCGDGVVLGTESCDDGNDVAGDGCAECVMGSEFLTICGDARLTSLERCDDGINDGSYGSCAIGCMLGPRCGDGEVNPDFEECDDIDHLSRYDFFPGNCAPGCVLGWHCGDGIVDGTQGEECDDGVNNGAYGGCTTQCLLGPHCGDAQVTDGERCDDGNRRNGDGCNLLCRIETRIETAMPAGPMLR